MEIDRIQKVSKEDFLEKYIKGNKPVIVTDAMHDWDLERFQPETLKKEFGSEYTQIYNDLFDLQNIDSLENYLTANFSKPDKECKNYIRWYTQLKGVDFLWSDEIFVKLKDAWSHPYFVPKNNLLIPFIDADTDKDITEERYPYKGLFISGKGARTRLHRDPFNSNAILCQLYGKKEMLLFAPDQAEYVMNGTEFVDTKHPDLEKFPNYSKATPTYKLVLSPGEIIIFPAGWFHDVTCASDSISITWNFVHASGLKNFQSIILKNPEDDQLEIVKFFLDGQLPADADVNTISQFLEEKFSKSIA